MLDIVFIFSKKLNFRSIPGNKNQQTYRPEKLVKKIRPMTENASWLAFSLIEYAHSTFEIILSHVSFSRLDELGKSGYFSTNVQCRVEL